MQARHFDALVFSLKAAVASVTAVAAYKFLKIPGTATWAAISAVLVMQPSLHPSFKASFVRVVANLLGAMLGAGLLFVFDNPVTAMFFGILLAGLICHFIKLGDALRPAYAAVIIVTFTVSSTGDHLREPLDRIFAVLIGCACSLVISFVMDKLSGCFKINGKEQTTEHEANE